MTSQNNITLSANVREEHGKAAVGRMRRAGLIPAVLYSRREKPVSLKLNPRELYKAVSTESGLNALINLSITGGEKANTAMVLVKDLQIDPIARVYLHADLMQVSLEDEVKVAIPVQLKGKAHGVIEGGILQQVMRELMVFCRAGSIPKLIEIDVSLMEIGDSLHISDIKLPEGVRPAVSLAETIAACVPPEEEVVETPAAVAADGAAPAEGAAPTDGAAPAEGAAAAPAAGKEGGDKKGEKK